MMTANITPMEPVVPHAVELSTIVINSAAEANAAHRRIVGSVQDAIAIGEFLTMKKQSLPHGQWLPWLKANIEFAQNTAWRYMNLAANRGKLSTLDSLDAAYKLLSAPVKGEERKPNPEPKKAQQPKTEPASAYKPEEKEAEVVEEKKSWSAFEDQDEEVELTVEPMEEESDQPAPEAAPKLGSHVRMINSNETAYDYTYNALIPAIRRLNPECETFLLAYSFILDHLESLKKQSKSKPAAEPELANDQEHQKRREQWRKQHNATLYGNGKAVAV